MKIETKTATLAMALFMALTIMLTIVALPNVKAQAASSKKTYAFIGVAPNPIGVGQQAFVHIGIPDALQTATDGWNLTVTVTKPDSKTETLGPYKTDSTGGTGIAYIPEQVGTYYLQANFPAQWYNFSGRDFLGNPVVSNVMYEASTSPKIALNVTEEPVQYYPGVPLPTEYWTRPINAQLREWKSVSGNWLVATPILPTDNLYAPDNDDAPESAHVLWSRSMGDTIGGLAGGVDETGYGIGDAYEGKWGGACIIGGVLFYNKFESGQAQQQVVAVNLHTGKELWTKTFFGNQRISFGQVVRWKSMNYQGDFSYLWVVSGTNWYAFEPLTGEWRYNMTSVPSGSNYYGPKGEILRYTVNQARGWMTQWNTTSVVVKGNTGMGVAWGSQVRGKEFNATLKGYDWNVTIPTGLPGSVRTAKPLDRVIGAAISTAEVTVWGLNLKPGQEGQLLFKTTWQAPSAWTEGNETISWAAASIDDKVAVLYSKERTNYYAFSLETGNFLWGPTESEHYLNIYDRISTINYGRLVSSGCSGDVICYNATTGDVLWSYTARDPYTESLTGNTWWVQQL
ncbi:MAG TPA: PQQ-binding-like beta-propeller repeat protein, partial [Candidatus Bathyarchaeia archaeon]